MSRLLAVALGLGVLLGACSNTSVSTSQSEVALPATQASTVDASDMTTDPTSTTEPGPATTLPEVGPPALSLVQADPVVGPYRRESFTNPGAIILHDGVYHMFRNSFSSFPGPSTVTLLTSPDGLVWDEATEDPVFGSDFVDQVDGTVFMFSGFVDADGTWVGYFYTFEGFDEPAWIGRATAPDPEGPWTSDPDPVLEPGRPGSWDDQRLAEPSVVRFNGQWLMYYTGFSVIDGNGRIGLATSDDGVTWTKHDDPLTAGPAFGESDPVLFPARLWEGNSIGGPQVIAPGEGLAMLYDLADLQSFGVGMAVSADGVNWMSIAQEPLLTVAGTPNGRRFFQSELFEAPDGPQLMLEVFDEANVRTELYPFSVDLDALRSAEPAVAVSAIATLLSGDVVVEVLSTGFEPRFVRGDDSGETGHIHVYVDRDPPAHGDDVPLGDSTIVHSTTSTIVISGMEPGLHELWVVVADGVDKALVPPEPVRLDVFIP